MHAETRGDTAERGRVREETEMQGVRPVREAVRFVRQCGYAAGRTYMVRLSFPAAIRAWQ